MAIFKKQPKTVKEESVVKAEQSKAEQQKKTELKKAAKRAARNVLVKPWITERATDLSALNKYVFLVDESATKPLVKENIAERYNIKPVAVDIVNIKGKLKYFKNQPRRRQSIKKAIITLKKGDKIEIQ